MGIYAFNGSLVGLAIPTFIPIKTAHGVLLAVLFVCLASYICSAVHVAIEAAYPGRPVLTYPFNIATTMFLPALLAGEIWDGFRPETPGEAEANWDAGEFMLSIIKGPGQVFLASDWKAGALVLLGVTVWSWRGGLLCAAGSTIGTLMAWALTPTVKLSMIYEGLFGYNACLVMMALCHVFYPFNPMTLAGAGFGAVLSVPVQLCVAKLLPCPALTWPFCLCTMFYLALMERPGEKESPRADEVLTTETSTKSAHGTEMRTEMQAIEIRAEGQTIEV